MGLSSKNIENKNNSCFLEYTCIQQNGANSKTGTEVSDLLIADFPLWWVLLTAGRGRTDTSPEPPWGNGGSGPRMWRMENDPLCNLPGRVPSRRRHRQQAETGRQADAIIVPGCNIPGQAHTLCSTPDRSPQSPSRREQGRQEGRTRPLLSLRQSTELLRRCAQPPELWGERGIPPRPTASTNKVAPCYS